MGDWDCYLERYPDLQKAFGTDAGKYAKAESHYNDHGKEEGRNCKCLSTCNWNCYLERYSDCRKHTGQSPAGHFLFESKEITKDGVECGELWELFEFGSWATASDALPGNAIVAQKQYCVKGTWSFTVLKKH